MEKHRCKLCWRRFGSGRALGGHMRSHVMNPSMYIGKEVHESDMESGDEEMELELEMEMEEGEVEVEEGSVTDSVIVQERESESENSRRVMTGRRSKRLRPASMQSAGFESKEKRLKSSEVCNRSEFWSTNELEQGSDVSDSTVEDVAFCLMMLSRDKWDTPKDKHVVEEEEEEEDVRVEAEVASENDSTKQLSKMKSVSNEMKVREKFKCETCSKTFNSYQALGGHKASHNKVRPVQNLNTSAELKHTTQSTDRRTHQCPICHRVFNSGQALGGHKRTHANMVPEIMQQQPERPPVMCRDIVIDLNFPAPAEEDSIHAL